MILPTIIDGVMSIGGGAYICLLAFGFVAPGRDKERSEAFLKRWGTLLKVGGPLIIVWGLYDVIHGI
jgi:hypothetical protein